MTRRRAALRIVAGVLQVGLAASTVAAYWHFGFSRSALALAALTAGAVALSLFLFRTEA